MASDDDWTEVVGNLQKERKIWARLSRILGREGYNTRVLVVLFKAVVQTVMLFGAETWVMTPHIGRALEGFQHRVTRQITGRNPHWKLYVICMDKNLK